MEREQAMNALNHIDPALIEAADLPVKGRKPRWVRMALTAACICVALLGTVYAVETVTGIRFLRFMEPQEIEWGDMLTTLNDGFELYEIAEPVSVDCLSDEVMELVQKYPNDDLTFRYKSWDDAEAFLGIELQDNPVLDAAIKVSNFSSMHTKPYSISQAHCVVSLGTSDGQPRGFQVKAVYRIQPENEPSKGTVRVEVWANVYTDLMVESAERTTNRLFHEGTAFRESSYTTPSGLETVIVQVDRSNCVEDYVLDLFEEIEYYAYFNLNHASFEVHAVSDPEDPDLALTTLKEVLDNFS